MNETTTAAPKTGYVVERIFANELRFVGVPNADELPENDSKLQFGWDWNLEADHRFTVRFLIELKPSRERPENVHVAMAAVVRRDGNPTVPLTDYVKLHAPALLLPFLRETIASLTGRGLHGAFYLPPINVASIMRGVDLEQTEGMKQIRERDELAVAFGLAEPAEVSPSKAKEH